MGEIIFPSRRNASRLLTELLETTIEIHYNVNKSTIHRFFSIGPTGNKWCLETTRSSIYCLI